MDFHWNDSPGNIARRKTGGKRGMLFLANSAARLMDPYVPADNLVLAQNISITAEENCGHVTYNSPYAHYQYTGELYLTEDGRSYAEKGERKYPTGTPLQYHTAGTTDHWFEHAKQEHGKEWLELVRKEVGKG